MFTKRCRFIMLVFVFFMICSIPALASPPQSPKGENPYIKVSKAEIKEIKSAAMVFLKAWSKGDYGTAYSYFSKSIKEQVSKEEFLEKVKATPNEYVTIELKDSIEVMSAEEDKAVVAGSLFKGPIENRGVAPGQNDIQIALIKEGDRWMITGPKNITEAHEESDDQRPAFGFAGVTRAADEGYPCNFVHGAYWTYDIYGNWFYINNHCSPYPWCNKMFWFN